MRDDLLALLKALEGQPSLLDPEQLRARLSALDELDRWLPARLDAFDKHADLIARAQAFVQRLEAANELLYEVMREEIRNGAVPDLLMQMIAARKRTQTSNKAGLGYDALDELLSGILGYNAPDVGRIRQNTEEVAYQPTPARLIFDLLEQTALTAEDVLLDLGSGLGHVPLLASICTPARCIGVDVEPAYIAQARKCAQRLQLDQVKFLQQDARKADLTTATVFYLYTPFTGSILRSVLDRLRDESARRPFRVCTYGPCSATLANETWLKPAATPLPEQITIFYTRQ